MWTILLVEDEVFVREAIKELLNWESHGFTVIAEAGSGNEALEAIKTYQPDVVISDIVMPGMDGIELLKETRKAGIRSYFIMLTAMNQFDYARDALQYGAFNYLLKLSLDDDILLENLSKIKAALLRELITAGELLHPQFHRIWSELGATGSSDIVMDKRSLDTMQQFHRLQLDIIATLSGTSVASADDAAIDSEQYIFIQTFFDAGQTTFFCWKWGQEATIDQSVAHSLLSLPGNWMQATNELNQQWYKNEDKLTDALTVKGDNQYTIEQLEVELIRFFEERNETRCMEVLRRIWAMMEQQSYSHVAVKKTATHLLHMMTRLGEGSNKTWEKVDAAVCHYTLLADVQSEMQTLLRKIQEEYASYTDHPEINKAIQYMLEHYQDNIKVSDLAKQAAFNVDYFSTVFGKKTGQTPITYLRNIRLEQAKRLLIHSKLSVEEIASETGFTDDAYFIKIFKREVGQTPSSFRRDQNI